MAGGGGVQDGDVHAVVYHFQHAGFQEPGVQHHGLARLQIHLHPVFLPQPPHQPDQPFPVVVVPGNVVAAAQIQPFQAGQIRPELFLKGGQGGFQRVGILLAQGVEMQPVQQGQQLRVKIRQGGAQAAARGAGIIDGVALLGGAFGIHPQPHLLARRFGHRAEPAQLGRAVEYKMVGVVQQLIKLFRLVGRAEYMGLPAEFLFAQPGLVQAAGGAASQILPQQRVAGKHGKGLLCQQDAAARRLADLFQNLQVLYKP